jgi:hypothetical protein
MHFTVESVLMLVAFVCFLLAAFNVNVKKVSLTALGLAVLTLSLLLESAHIKLP